MIKRQPKKANENSIKKGEVKNPKGRPKGSENKRTKEQREAFVVIMELLEKRMMDGDDVIKNLNPRAAGELYATLLNYQKPKLSATKNENTNEIKGDVKINISWDEDSQPTTNEGGEDE